MESDNVVKNNRRTFRKIRLNNDLITNVLYMKKIKEYCNILSHMNIWQTWLLATRIKHLRSSSIRVLHRANIFIHKSAKIVLGENSSLMINKWNTAIPTSQPCTLCLGANSQLTIYGHITLCEGAKLIAKAGGG